MSGDEDFAQRDAGSQRRAASARAGSRQTVRLLLYMELLAADGSALALGMILPGLVFGTRHIGDSSFGAVLPMLPLYVIFGLTNGAYTTQVLRRPHEGLRRALVGLGLAIITILLVTVFLNAGVTISRLTFLAQAISCPMLLTLGRVLVHRHVIALTDGRLANELVIVDGVGTVHKTSTPVVDAARLTLVPDAFDPLMLHKFGTLTKGFGRVVVHCDPERRTAWALFLKGADVDGEIVIEQFNEMGAIGLSEINGFDTVLVTRRALSLRHRVKKRVLDLSISVPLVILLLPLFGIIALAIKLDSPGPILFRQSRVGRANCMINVLKFRSMLAELSDSSGAQSTQRADHRITRVGHFIRKTSLDELPQLFNVVLGDMSLVGPRPHALGSLAGAHLFWEVDQAYWHRHRLKPGITGLAQIRGYRGTTANQLDLTNRLQADLEYIEGWHIWRDLRILVSTFKVIVHPNAY